eukprot:54835-Karenia_brevis.AAC.1
MAQLPPVWRIPHSWESPLPWEVMVKGNRGGRPLAREAVDPDWVVGTLADKVKDHGRSWFNVHAFDSINKGAATVIYAWQG